jgi:hypothetical protein
MKQDLLTEFELLLLIICLTSFILVALLGLEEVRGLAKLESCLRVGVDLFDLLPFENTFIVELFK